MRLLNAWAQETGWGLNSSWDAPGELGEEGSNARFDVKQILSSRGQFRDLDLTADRLGQLNQMPYNASAIINSYRKKTWENLPSTLVFDGKNLLFRGESFPATSGLNGEKDYRKKDLGPIPPGEYEIRIEEIVCPDPIRRWKLNRRGDWGDCRLSLHPAKGTAVFGRSGFYIHGGKTPGSHGCIDVGQRDRELMEKLMSNPGRYRLKVEY